MIHGSYIDALFFVIQSFIVFLFVFDCRINGMTNAQAIIKNMKGKLNAAEYDHAFSHPPEEELNEPDVWEPAVWEWRPRIESHGPRID